MKLPLDLGKSAEMPETDSYAPDADSPDTPSAYPCVSISDLPEDLPSEGTITFRYRRDAAESGELELLSIESVESSSNDTEIPESRDAAFDKLASQVRSKKNIGDDESSMPA